MSTQGYNVYKVQYRLGLQDPLIPGVRYHTLVFVETDADGGGWIHHVTGDITSVHGMTYQRKRGRKPEESNTFHQKTYLGQVHVSDYPEVVDGLLQSIRPPPRQRSFNTSTMSYEQCKPDGTLYQTDEPRPPYSKCTEWTEQKAIPALQQQGLIYPNGISSSSTAAFGASDETQWVWDEQHQQYRRWDGGQWVWA